MGDIKSSAKWWGKVTAAVIHDKELSPTAKVVFCELALWAGEGRNEVSRGQRAIAEAVGCTQTTACLCLKDLSRRGHIRIVGDGQKRRRYQLCSTVYRKVYRGEAHGEVVEYREDGDVMYRRLVS